jgi:hypothetical protein
MKRASWVDSITSALLSDPGLDPVTMQEVYGIDEVLFAIWNLGENIVLAWTMDHGDLRFLAVRHYELLNQYDSRVATSDAVREVRDYVDTILAGPKAVAADEFERRRLLFGAAAQVVRAELGPYLALHADLISGLVTRYSVSLVRERAVVLLDAVDFSLHTPIEQVAMLNSLSYSVNSAYRQLISADVQINFARTTTGDGFYLWNRVPTFDASVALYKLLLLTLADNAVAQSKARGFPVPRLRAAFHVGEHYEFYQVEALNPTTFSYIVGPVTIDLARFLEKALPGQILLGDFAISMRDPATGCDASCSTLEFIERTAMMLSALDGLAVANDHIESIGCYLTGERAAGGGFGVRRYRIRDKHDLPHAVYNAKLNIHLGTGKPIFLGYQHKDLHPRGGPDLTWAGST